MPIARNPAQHNYHWIPREAETEFQNLLKDGKAYVLPLVGVGGAGKTSLLRRLFSYCERHEIPALYIDLPRLIVSGALDMWLRVETVHTKAFDEHRKKLNTSYETLSAMLQPYGDNASGAAELLQKGVGKDENYGLAVGAIRDVGKLAYEFWQRRENQQQQELLQKPEETLLRALAKDFQKRGVILIDTLEQAGKQNLSTRLRFREDGELETPAAEHPRTANLIEYCAGMAHFLFDKPVIMVLAGRPPAIRELGALPLDYFAPTVDVPAFTADEIRTYLESSLPRQIAPPQGSDISKLQQLTLGNPFLLERVVRLLADWQPTWEWKAEQWQPLLNSFQQDERHGLLLYVTQRLLTHVLPDDRAFWRLALPRQFIHRDMAELLFPKDEFGEQSGLQRLRLYEEKGTVYREQDPDRYFLHDETRAAFTAWAKREKVWLDKAACDIHARLAAWFNKKSHIIDSQPQEINKKLQQAGSLNGCIRGILNCNNYGQNPSLTIDDNRSEFLESSYHTIMSDSNFEDFYPEHTKEEFFSLVAGSIRLSSKEKNIIAGMLSTLDKDKFKWIIDTLKKEINKDKDLFSCFGSLPIREHVIKGKVGINWLQDECYLRNSLRQQPNNIALLKALSHIEGLSSDELETIHIKICTLSPTGETLGNLAIFMQNVRKDYDRAETFFQQAIDSDPSHAINLGNFADFMNIIREDYDHAETLYQRAIDADPKDSVFLMCFANFIGTVRKDYDRAETLYQQAIDVNSHPYIIGNFAVFMKNIRKDYDRSETLYQQAIDAAPKDARNVGNFADFMHTIRKDYDRAEALYQQAIDADPKHANNLGNFAKFTAEIRQNYDMANKLFLQGVEASPNDHWIVCEYSRFLHYKTKQYDLAEQFYQKAFETSPTCPTTLSNFAGFMHIIRKDYDRAETLYQQAIDADPKDADNLGNFANFMYTIRKDYDRAATLYQQAIDADPKYAHNLGNFAYFMLTIRKDYDRAEALYQQAIDADPKHAHNLDNFATFLHVYRKNYPQAQQLYHRALEVEPNDANNMANLAQLYLMEGDTTQGKTLIDQAFATNPEATALKLELWFYRLAHFPQDYPQAEAEIMALLETGARSEGWDFSGNIARAEQDGHPNIALLRTLADTICGLASETQAAILR